MPLSNKPQGDQERSSLSGVRVLVVEDAWHVAKAIKSTLEEAGMDVAGPAATTSEARRLTAQHILKDGSGPTSVDRANHVPSEREGEDLSREVACINDPARYAHRSLSVSVPISRREHPYAATISLRIA